MEEPSYSSVKIFMKEFFTEVLNVTWKKFYIEVLKYLLDNILY